MGTFLTNELDTLTAQPIIDRLFKTLDDIRIPIFTNYIQSEVVKNEKSSDNQSYIIEDTFKLDHKPLINSLYIMVNGVAYVNNKVTTFYEYNETENLLHVDPRTSSIREGSRLTIVYSYVVEDK